MEIRKEGGLRGAGAPDEARLAKINAYARTPLTAEAVYCFRVRLCDDRPDRDFERFDTAALPRMAELFRGKTGICDHQWSADRQVARIFDTQVVREDDGASCLMAEAYALRTERNADLIADIEGGIKKEVSVGCAMGQARCSICGEPYGTCAHRKGAVYDGETCLSVLSEPLDAYEFSFVAVPAQRAAGVTKAGKEGYGMTLQDCVAKHGSHDREQLRRQGDIVTANLHAITRGQTLLRAEDFYDEDLREIEIPLKPNLSPQQNAARFYKDYARAKHAEQVLTQQIAQGEIEEAYLGGVLEELARAENERDLSEIRAELEAGGYVRPADRRKQARQQPSKPMHFRSSDGFDIFVGRNNRQNDQLSLKTARRDDLWLHVQKFHGTHVIIACAGIQPPDGTITEAAELAAYYSEAREGQNVPVDVTPVRFLRKPNGAKPGMVVYDRYRTVLVTPDAALPARLRVE